MALLNKTKTVPVSLGLALCAEMLRGYLVHQKGNDKGIHH